MKNKVVSNIKKLNPKLILPNIVVLGLPDNENGTHCAKMLLFK
jgi:hypothetical protein